jgi:hypothetical protein
VGKAGMCAAKVPPGSALKWRCGCRRPGRDAYEQALNLRAQPATGQLALKAGNLA